VEKQQFIAISARGGAIVATATVLQIGVAFCTQILLVRILDPEHFGQLAFASMVAMSLNALSNMHGDKFVIREESDPRRNLDVAFTFELVLAASAFFLMVGVAPLVMEALGRSELTIFVQVLAVSFFYNPLCRPRCLQEREFAFFRSRFPYLAAQIVAAGLALTMATSGFGLWSLVAWRLSILAGEVSIHWMIAPYRPRLAWEREVLARLLKFGWPLVGSAFLVFFYSNVDVYIIGNTLEDGITQLGYYWLAINVGQYLLRARVVFHGVFFPIFSRMRDETSRSVAFEKLSHAVGGAFLLPAMVGIFFGRDLVLLALGEKWGPAVFPLQMVLVVVLTRAVNASCGSFLHSRGITRADFGVAVLYSLLLPPLVWLGTRRFGIDGAAVAVLATTLVATSYSFSLYIRPLVGRGTLHFLARPWVAAGASFAAAEASRSYALGWLERLCVFALLLLMAYFVVFRRILSDLRAAGVTPAALWQLRLGSPESRA
jgi:O-antigen/teichoic acid export membrane protein